MCFFSVIIPSFNRLEFLKKAITSVQNQSFKDFEIIVVDDASKDLTEKYLSKLKDIKYLKNIKKQGVSFSRNLAVKEARGEWLAFLDSDDQWFEQKLKYQYEYIQENKNIEILHSNERWIRNGVRVNQMKKHKKSGGDIFKRSLELCLISPSAVCLKKSLFEKMGGFREDFIVCEDYDLWLKISSEYEIGFIEEDLILKFGGHEDQLSQKYKAMDYYRIKSIDWILRNKKLKDDKKSYALEVLKRKCEILLKGYLKHNNFQNYDEILQIQKNYF